MKSEALNPVQEKRTVRYLKNFTPNLGTIFILVLPIIITIGYMIWMQLFANVPLDGKGQPAQIDDLFPVFTCDRILRPDFVACGITTFAVEIMVLTFLLYINPITLMTLAILYILKTAYQTKNTA